MIPASIMEERIENRDAVVVGPSLSKVGKSQAAIFAVHLGRGGLEEGEGSADEAEGERVVPIDLEQQKKNVNKFVREVLNYQFEMEKVLRSLDRGDREAREYEALLKDIEAKMGSMETEISGLEEELALQQRIRGCKEVLETRARAVRSLPAQSALEHDIQLEDKENAVIHERLAGYEKQLDKWADAATSIRDTLDQFAVTLTGRSTARGDNANGDSGAGTMEVDEDHGSVAAEEEDPDGEDEGRKARLAENKSTSKRKRTDGDGEDEDELDEDEEEDEDDATVADDDGDEDGQ